MSFQNQTDVNVYQADTVTKQKPASNGTSHPSSTPVNANGPGGNGQDEGGKKNNNGCADLLKSGGVLATSFASLITAATSFFEMFTPFLAQILKWTSPAAVVLSAITLAIITFLNVNKSSVRWAIGFVLAAWVILFLSQQIIIPNPDPVPPELARIQMALQWFGEDSRILSEVRKAAFRDLHARGDNITKPDLEVLLIDTLQDWLVLNREVASSQYRYTLDVSGAGELFRQLINNQVARQQKDIDNIIIVVEYTIPSNVAVGLVLDRYEANRGTNIAATQAVIYGTAAAEVAAQVFQATQTAEAERCYATVRPGGGVLAALIYPSPSSNQPVSMYLTISQHMYVEGTNVDNPLSPPNRQDMWYKVNFLNLVTGDDGEGWVLASTVLVSPPEVCARLRRVN